MLETATASSFFTNNVDCCSVTCSVGNIADHYYDKLDNTGTTRLPNLPLLFCYSLCASVYYTPWLQRQHHTTLNSDKRRLMAARHRHIVPVLPTMRVN